MKNRKGWRYCIAPFASLKLAIFTMICLALLVAIGTVVESRYDADFAREQVYHRWWMFFLLILLAINLTAVMIHRWPWRPRHLGFLLAHLGILTLLAGSLWTYLWGIDGSLYLPIKSRIVIFLCLKKKLSFMLPLMEKPLHLFYVKRSNSPRWEV